MGTFAETAISRLLSADQEYKTSIFRFCLQQTKIVCCFRFRFSQQTNASYHFLLVPFFMCVGVCMWGGGGVCVCECIYIYIFYHFKRNTEKEARAIFLN
jgi:hypothetical protein